MPEHMVQQQRRIKPEQKRALVEEAGGKCANPGCTKPGLLRVQGHWPSNNGAVLITRQALSFCRPGALRPTSLVGDGENSVIVYAGPITTALFGFA